MRKLLTLLTLLLLLPPFANASYLKISTLIGFGNFQASREGKQKSEGPMSFSTGVDYDINSRWSLGAEHMRSLNLSPLGTSVSMTGLTGRFYYLSPVPNPIDEDAAFVRARVLQKGWFPYIGWSFGFAQASLDAPEDADNVIALSLAIALKAGADLPIYKNFALRTEINLGMPLLGSGEVSFSNLLIGGIYFW